MISPSPKSRKKIGEIKDFISTEIEKAKAEAVEECIEEYPKIIKCYLCGNAFGSENEKDNLCDVCFKKYTFSNPMTTPQLLHELKKTIFKGFGKHCKDYNWACSVCNVWSAYSILEDLLREDEN